MKTQLNTSAVAFLRVSSHRQRDNTSHETQEQEIRLYCAEHGLELARVVRMVESAKTSSERAHYSEGLRWALKHRVRNVLFYIFDRETRNLTDNETNERLVREGKFVIHYVRERKVYRADSSDSDFFLRDIQAVTNKQYIRQLSTKVIDAMRTKAESGHYPGNRPPLGYVNERLRDESGRELKRGTIVVRDPNERNVKRVLLEFELRAQGYSCQQIVERLKQDGFTKNNFKSAVERRLRNPFYYGNFEWQNQTYKGKHEVFIPAHILDAVKRSFAGNTYQRKVSGEHGILGGGFLKCADSACGCYIVYDPKVKRLIDGGTKTHHYYHCTNGKRIHARLKNVTEVALWDGLAPALDDIWLDDVLASEIANALNESFATLRRQRQAELASYRGSLSRLEDDEDRAYQDMRKGLLDECMYQRQIARLRDERRRYTDLLESATAEMDAQVMENCYSTLELAKQAKSLWLERSGEERLEFLKLILSNATTDGLSVRYELAKPFALLKEMRESSDWRPLVDAFRTACTPQAA